MSVVASLSPPRLGAQAVVAKGNLYVLGGYNKGTNLSLVERTSIKRDGLAEIGEN